MQPQFEAKGLEVPYRGVGANLHSKAEESGVSCPQMTAIEKCTSSRRVESARVTTSPSTFVPSVSLAFWTVRFTFRVDLPQFADPHASLL